MTLALLTFVTHAETPKLPSLGTWTKRGPLALLMLLE
jgi:hypothetical protein